MIDYDKQFFPMSMNKMMNKNKLHDLLLNMAIFDEVAEQGSFSATAQALQMTPSSVSKRIAKLEDELNVKLIERTTRTMRLTNTGEQFRTHCHNMLNEANSAIAITQQAQDKLIGEVSISAPKAFANLVLQPVILQFLQAYPHINVQVLATDTPVDLLRKNIDCSIEIGTPSDYLIAKPLLAVRQVLCATPHYLSSQSPPITPIDLQKHNCLSLGETDNDNQWLFIKENLSITVNVTGRYVVNHSNMRLQGVLNHLGIGCFPDFVVKNLLETGELVEVLTDWQLQANYHGMAWLTYLPNKFQSLRLRRFIEFLQKNISDKTA